MSYLHTCFRVSKNPEDLNCNPSNPFSCDTAIMTEVADVKPTVTGTDMKSIKTPENPLVDYIFYLVSS